MRNHYIAHPVRISCKPPIVTTPSDCDKLLKRNLIREAMRVAWLDHVYWTRLLLVSIADRLGDEPATTERLMQNPHDIAAVFANFYPADITNKITALIAEHLQLGAALITALRDNKSTEANELARQWYANADDMAKAFASINPNYDYAETRKMLYSHLDKTTAEVAARLKGDYRADIAAFEDVKNEAIEMADYFSKGLGSVDRR